MNKIRNVASLFVVVFMLLNSPISSAAIMDYGYYFKDTNTGLDWLDVTLTKGKSRTQIRNMIINHESITGKLSDGTTMTVSLEGWAFAYVSNFNRLMKNVGAPPPEGEVYASPNDNLLIPVYERTYSRDLYTHAEGLTKLFGYTRTQTYLKEYGDLDKANDDFEYGDGTGGSTLGLLGRGGGPVGGDYKYWVASIEDFDSKYHGEVGSIFTRFGMVSADDISVTGRDGTSCNPFGTFLVRRVPEPISLTLLGAGLFGLVIPRRKLKKHW